MPPRTDRDIGERVSATPTCFPAVYAPRSLATVASRAAVAARLLFLFRATLFLLFSSPSRKRLLMPAMLFCYRCNEPARVVYYAARALQKMSLQEQARYAARDDGERAGNIEVR